MEKYNDLNLVALEVMMLECAEDDWYITESAESTVRDLGTKILNDLNRLIGAMTRFVKDVKADIVTIGAKKTMKAKLNVLKMKAKNGQSVSIPDFKKIESVYMNAGNVLPRELKKLLKAAYPIRTSNDLARFEERKVSFEKSLMVLENNLEEIISSSKTYSAKDAYRIIDKLLHGDSIYINTYYKAIREFEQFKNEYEKILKDVCAKNDSLGKKSISMHKSLVAKTSTTLSRMMKKSVFLVSAITV